MFHSKVHIEAGDLVILYMTRVDMLSIIVTPGESFHNKYGMYSHDAMIGMKYGSKMHSPPPQSGYIHLLRPTPELWTLSLPHRTQILYMPDIAYIIMRLGVRVGGRVIEAGTGSGSMTHSLARAVGDRGYVGSYEYHATRYEKAKAEFESHKLDQVRLQHRNVCKDGFGEVDNVEGVFLDLPAPWEAIPHAVKCLRSDVISRICCFSPCLEQVLKTVSTLREHGFSDISTQEVSVRTYELSNPPLPGSKHLRDVTSIVADLRAHEQKKEARRAYQMRTAREKAARIKEAKVREDEEAKLREDEARGMDPREEMERMLMESLREDVTGDAESADVAGIGRDREVQEEKEDIAEGDVQADSRGVKRKEANGSQVDPEFGETASKRRKTLGGIEAPADEHSQSNHRRQSGDRRGISKSDHKTSWNTPVEPSTSLSEQTLLRIQPEMRGHTSYLTFAAYYPRKIRDDLALQGMKHSGSLPAIEQAASAGRKGEEATRGQVAEGGKGKGGAGAGAAPGTSGEVEAAPTERTETEYGDHTMEEVMGTMTEEEMVAMMGASTAAV